MEATQHIALVISARRCHGLGDKFKKTGYFKGFNEIEHKCFRKALYRNVTARACDGSNDFAWCPSLRGGFSRRTRVMGQ